MNDWIPKNKTVKFATAVIILSVLLYLAGLWVVYGEIKKIENLYASTDSESSREQKFLAVKSIAESNMATIQTLRNFFVQKGDEVKFIEEIEGVAKASAAKSEITAIDVKASPKDSVKEDVDIKISLEGSWGEVVGFIDKIKKMPFGVSIETLNLNANTPGSWSGSVELIVFREK